MESLKVGGRRVVIDKSDNLIIYYTVAVFDSLVAAAAVGRERRGKRKEGRSVVFHPSQHSSLYICIACVYVVVYVCVGGIIETRIRAVCL